MKKLRNLVLLSYFLKFICKVIALFSCHLFFIVTQIVFAVIFFALVFFPVFVFCHFIFRPFSFAVIHLAEKMWHGFKSLQEDPHWGTGLQM